MRHLIPIFSMILSALLSAGTPGSEKIMYFHAEEALPAEEVRQTYQLYLDDGESAYFDENGELVPGGEPTFYRKLYDVLSGEPVYYVRSYRYLLEKDDIKDAETVTEYQALYSLDGKLLADWEPRCYENAIGSLVTYCDADYLNPDVSAGQVDAALWDPLTDTVILEDAAFLFHCTESSAVVLSAEDYILGVVDAEGNLKASSMPLHYSHTGSGYTVGYEYNLDENGEIVNENLDWYLLDSDMNILLSGRFYGLNMYRDGIYGEYIYVRGYPDAVRRVVRLSDMETVFTVPSGKNIVEFNGEYAVLCEGENTRGTYEIYNLQGEIIAGPYDEAFTPSSYDLSDTAPDFLFAVNGNTVQKIDWQGNVLAGREIENYHSIGYAGGGRYIYRITPVKDGHRDYDNIQCGILDDDFNIILDANADDGIGRIRHLADDPLTGSPRFLGHRSADVDGQDRYCLLDENGRVLFDGISDLGYRIDNISEIDGVVPVRCGSSIGLIDLNGNWLHVYPVSEAMGSE